MTRRALSAILALCLSLAAPGEAQTRPMLPPGPAEAATRPNRSIDAIDVRDLGARCDGITDDSTAFQSAFDAAAASGKTVAFGGTCVVGTAIRETTDPIGGVFALHGNSTGVILTHDNDLFDYTSPRNHPGFHLAKFDFRDFDITNKGTPNRGTLLSIDCAALQNFCTGPVSVVEGIHATDIATLLHGVTVNDIYVQHNFLTRYTPVSAASFEVLEGPTGHGGTTAQQYTAGIFNTDNQVSGGNFLITVGGVQGVVDKFNYLLVGQRGVYEVAPVGIEQLQNFDNYFEASLNGIDEPVCGFCQTEGNSFDAGPLRIAGTWFAIRIGAPHSPQAGNQLDHNTVFGMQGEPTAAPVIYANLQTGSAIDGNVVDGLIASTPACMLVGSDAAPAAQIVSVAGNTCWAANAIAVFGAGVTTRGNTYSPDGRRNLRVPDRN